MDGIQVKAFTDLALEYPDALPGKGIIPSKYVWVGPAPPIKPNPRLEPLTSSSNSMLHKVLGIQGEPIFRTNLVREPYATTSKKKLPIRLIRQYYPYLVDEMRLVQPERILAIGKAVAETLCPGFKKMKEDHGTFFYNPELGSYVIPTYDFNRIRGSFNLRTISVRDLERFFELPDPKPATVYKVGRISSLAPLVAANKHVYFDIETTGLDLEDKIIMIGLAWKNGEHVHIIYNPSRKTLRQLVHLFRRLDPIIVGSNLAFDLSHINHHAGTSWLPRIKDTMVEAYCLGMGKGDWDERKRDYEAGKSLSLKHLTTMLTDRPGSRAFGGTEDPLYLAEDVLSAREVHGALRKQIKAAGGIPILSTLHKLVPQVALQYKRGVFLNYGGTRAVLRDAKRRAKRADLALAGVANINWGSNQQVVAVFQKKGIPLDVKTKTSYSVAEDPLLSLERRGYQVAKDLLERRGSHKELEFLQSYWGIITRKDPRLFPRLLLTTTDTGRPSMRDPNLQQVPRVGPIKSLFISRWGGNIGIHDLDTVELCAAAWIHGDETLAKALVAEDAHKAIAARLFHQKVEDVTVEQRKKSKAVTYGSLFLGTAKGIAAKGGFKRSDVQDAQNRFWKEHPHLKEMFQKSIKKALKDGVIQGFLGRYRDIRELIREEGERSASRKIVNTPIQQLASDMLLMLMSWINPKLEGMKSKILFSIHDSTFFDLYPGETKLVAEVVDASYAWIAKRPELQALHFFPNELPLTGEMYVGENWAECEQTNEGFDPLMKYTFSTAA